MIHATPEIDGALTGEELIFQLVDGNSLYDFEKSFTVIQLPVIGSVTLNSI